MKEYWANLNKRERMLVIITGVLLLIYLSYLLVFAPLTGAVANKRRLLQERQETYAWMEQVRLQSYHKNTRKTVSRSKLLSIIASELSAKPFTQFPHQLQQTSQGDIQISFPAIPYAAFLSWLWTLDNTYQLSLKQLTLNRSETPGVVKISVEIAV